MPFNIEFLKLSCKKFNWNPCPTVATSDMLRCVTLMFHCGNSLDMTISSDKLLHLLDLSISDDILLYCGNLLDLTISHDTLLYCGILLDVSIAHDLMLYCSTLLDLTIPWHTAIYCGISMNLLIPHYILLYRSILLDLSICQDLLLYCGIYFGSVDIPWHILHSVLTHSSTTQLGDNICAWRAKKSHETSWVNLKNDLCSQDLYSWIFDGKSWLIT